MTAALAALLVLAWPVAAAAATMVRRRAGRTRWLRLFHRPTSSARRGIAVWAVRWWRGWLWRSWRSRGAAWWGPMLGGGLGIGLGLMVSGAVAATVLGAYGAAGVVVLRRRAQRQSQARAHRVATDAVVALAADLRAGVTTAEALATADAALLHAADLSIAPAVDASSESVARRLASAAVVSQTTGAPLADLLERLDAHVRAVDRAHALAQTQAAGARASAVLLAAMPLAGVGLGMAMGVDPGRVLLHTTLGGTALCFAVALQLGGLAWTARLARLEAPA